MLIFLNYHSTYPVTKLGQKKTTKTYSPRFKNEIKVHVLDIQDPSQSKNQFVLSVLSLVFPKLTLPLAQFGL